MKKWHWIQRSDTYVRIRPATWWRFWDRTPRRETVTITARARVCGWVELQIVATPSGKNFVAKKMMGGRVGEFKVTERVEACRT